MRPYLSLLLVSLLAVQAHTAKAVELTVDIDWQSMGVTPDLNARLGHSVADAGDVNGDGYGDVIVGAYLSGTVVDASDGLTPVHPVAIDLMDPDTGLSLYGVTNNPDGSYEFNDIAPGDYKIFFNAVDGANAYIDKLYGDEGLCSNGCDFAARGDIFKVELGNNQLDAGLEPGIEITGTVTETGTATGLAGVTVGFYDGGGGLVHVVDTDDAGNYRSGGLPPQSLYVVADGSPVGYLTEIFDNVLCPGGDCISVAGSATQLNPPPTAVVTANFDLDQDPPGSISGNIIGSDTGLPVEGIDLWMFDTDCNYIAGGETDANGDYSVEAADPGDYYLFAVGNDTLYIDQQSPYMNQQYPGIDIFDTCYPSLNDVTQGEAISVADREQVTGKDFVLNPGGIIRGTISDSNGVLAAGTANARLYGLDGVQQYVALNTEPDGSYRFGGIMSGTWHVVFSSDNLGLIDERYDGIQCPRNSCDSAQGMEVEVIAGNEITSVDAELESGAIVSGTMTDADSGLPVEGACANFYTAEGVYATIGCTDASGNYTSKTGLPPGEYRMSNQLKTHVYFGTDAGYAPQVWTSDGSYLWCGAECDFLLGDTFTVTGTTPVENIDLAMLSTATLSGTVVSAADGTTPVSPVEVRLWQGGGFTGLSAATAPDGSYEITGVEPGDYKVLFDAQGAAVTFRDELHDEVECGNGSCPIGFVGNTVTLAPGANTLDEDLTPGGGISGVISSSVTGQPLGAFEGRARLYQLDGTQLTTALTDGNGAWSFGGVAPGSYYVVLAPRFGNLIDELYDGVYCPRLSCDTSAGQEVSVTDGVVTSGIDATLDPGSRITGHFLTQDGTPVPAFTTLFIHTPEGVYAGFANTDENGFYQSGSGFPAGDYHVSQYDAGYLNTSYPNVPCGDPCVPTVGQLVSVDGVSDVGGIDFIAELDDGSVAAIFGTVVADDGGTPIDDVKICAVSKSDDGAMDCDVTGPHGTYLIGGLTPLADYAVYTEDVGGQAYFGEVHDSLDCCDTSAGTPVDLTSGNAMIDFGLATSGLITGKVTDVVTGEPITNVPIVLYDADGFQVNTIEFTTDDGEFPGQYAISGVPDGTFYVFARSEWQGYSNELYPDFKRIRAEFPEPITDGQAIVIENHTQVAGIDFQLDPAGSISGTISDSSGALPFNQARIRIYKPGSRALLNQYGNWNPDGTYTIPGLPPDTYTVLLTTRGSNLIGERFDDVQCPRNSCDLALGEPVAVGPEEHVDGIDATLDEGAVVAGIITDAETGVGVPNFCIGIYTVDGIYAAFACTDQDGNYGSSTGLPPGEYVAANQFFDNAIAGGYLPQVWTEDGSFRGCGVPCNVVLGDTFIVTGTTVSNAVNFEMEKGSAISGNVQADGAGLAGVSVKLLDALAAEIDSTQTDLNGDYMFDGIGSGDYYVRTENASGYEDRLHALPTDIVCDPDCNPFSGTVISADGSTDVTGIDFSLVQSGGISGLVMDSDTNPVAGVTVEAYNLLGSFVKSAITNAAGEYSIEGLGSGDHYVRSRNILGYRDDLYASTNCPTDCDVRLGTIVPVNSGTVTTGIDLELATGSAIEGTIATESAGGELPLNGAGISIYDASGILAAYVNSDANGYYMADGLDAGTYHVVTWNSAGWVDESADGSPCEGSCEPLNTAPVTLGAAEALVLEFVLQQGHWVPVYITDTEGNELSGIQVSVYDDQGGEIISRVTRKPSQLTNGIANAILPGIPPGDVYLKTYNELNFQDEIYDDVICRIPCDPAEGTRITTTGALDAKILHIVLEASNAISGVVYQSGTDPAVGLAGVGIELYTDNGLLLQTTTTGSGGSYSFGGLANGRYRLKTSGNHNFIDRVFGGSACSPEACDILAGSLVELVNSDRTDADFTLQLGKVIRGYARDVYGNPIAGFSELFNDSGAMIDRVAVDTSGLFHFQGIADGTYFIYTDAVSTAIRYQSCYNYYISHCDWPYGCHSHCNRRCETRTRYTTTIDTLYQAVSCPDRSCDVTSGQPIVLGGAASPASAIDAPAGVSEVTTIEIELPSGYNIRGSLTHMGAGIPDTPVYFFDQSGTYVGQAITDGLGEFVSESGLPNGTYFAATSRTATQYDTPEEAANAEDGVGQGLQDAAWDGFPCDGICAPSQVSGFGTPFVISGADSTGIDIVLGRAPGISVEKLTNGIDADTPNGGDAPEIAVGETVNWTFEVTNTGGEQLVNIVVTDNQDVTVNCSDNTLASGASMTCTASGPAVDLSQEPFTGVIGNCAGTPNWRLYQNTATVTAQTNGGADVDDTDSSHYCNPLPKPEVIFSNGFE